MRTTLARAVRRASAALVLACALALGAAASAGAEQSTGLYAPFPSPLGGPTAQRYVGSFGATVKPAQLQRGVALGGFSAGARGGAASARAGVSGGAAGTAGLIVGMVAVGVIAAIGVAGLSARNSRLE